MGLSPVDDHSPVMWERADAEKVVAHLGAAVAQHGCRLTMVGSVAVRGFSDKDLDIEMHVGEGKALERALAAIDAIRHARHLLVSHIDSQVMLLDAAFRPIELWLHMPAGFWNRVETTDALTDRLWRRIRADKMKAVTSVRRARERGRPADMGHVPLEVFERERERLAAYIGPLGKALMETRRQAHEALVSSRNGW